MASKSNFLTVKTHLTEFKGNSDKDTMSEVCYFSLIALLITIKHLKMLNRHFEYSGTFFIHNLTSGCLTSFVS